MTRILPNDRVEVFCHLGKGASDYDCRKPKPGMLLRAARELGIDLAQTGWLETVGGTWIAGTPPVVGRCSLIIITFKRCGKSRTSN